MNDLRSDHEDLRNISKSLSRSLGILQKDAHAWNEVSERVQAGLESVERETTGKGKENEFEEDSWNVETLRGISSPVHPNMFVLSPEVMELDRPKGASMKQTNDVGSEVSERVQASLESVERETTGKGKENEFEEVLDSWNVETLRGISSPVHPNMFVLSPEVMELDRPKGAELVIPNCTTKPRTTL